MGRAGSLCVVVLACAGAAVGLMPALDAFEGLGGRIHPRIYAHPAGRAVQFEASGRIVKGQVREQPSDRQEACVRTVPVAIACDRESCLFERRSQVLIRVPRRAILVPS